MRPYVTAVGLELSAMAQPQPVGTIFIGGGTPTYLSPDQLTRLLGLIRQWCPLRSGGEWSIEATPETITPETVAILAEHGVTRVSLGVQSFHRHLLPRLDRIHAPDHVWPAIDLLRERISSTSVDLIFGVPEQTIAEWQTDLETAVSLGIKHISTYGLTYEKGTPLWKQRERGQVIPVAENDEATMYEWAIDRLQNAGMEHYEVSNFAVPGWRCRHNEVYWANEAYFGVGTGAARFVMGRRELNVRNTADYVRRVLAGESPTFQSEALEPEEAARETAAIQLRRAEGIDRRRFELQTGKALDAIVADRVEPLVAEGLLVDDGRAVRLTRRGQCVADALVVKLVWG